MVDHYAASIKEPGLGTVYAAQVDIEAIFGVDNVKVWSDVNGIDAVNTDRIALAIAAAEEDLNDRFRDSKYVVPFSPVTNPTVTKWTATLAGLEMFDSRPGYKDADETILGFEKLRKTTDAAIDKYLSGQRRLNVNLKDSAQPHGPVAVV